MLYVLAAVLARPAADVAEPLLETVGLQCERGERVLFRDINIEAGAGELVHVHGANGSGKTSLLRILCGLTLPSEGEVRWCGESIHAAAAHHLAQIHYVGHSNGVKLELSPLENLRVARALAHSPTAEDPQQALQRFGLYGFEDIPAYALSAGQRRRVALARLLIDNARMWVLDEPFTAMDRAGVKMIEDLVHEHLQTGGIVVLTTHQPMRFLGERTKEVHLVS